MFRNCNDILLNRNLEKGTTCMTSVARIEQQCKQPESRSTHIVALRKLQLTDCLKALWEKSFVILLESL